MRTWSLSCMFLVLSVEVVDTGSFFINNDNFVFDIIFSNKLFIYLKNHKLVPLIHIIKDIDKSCTRVRYPV